jgi:transposase
VGALGPFVAYLNERWRQGCHNITQLYREVKEQGFTGTYGNVYRYLERARVSVPGATRAATPMPYPAPSARSTSWMLLLTDRPRTAEQEAYLSNLCALSAEVCQGRDLGLAFMLMVRERRAAELDAWLAEAAASASPELRSLATSLRRDKAAVLAALSEPYSNGQTEGQINRLKLVKRSMYGRANPDLLRARVLPMAEAA